MLTYVLSNGIECYPKLPVREVVLSITLSLPLFYAAGIYLRESPEHAHTHTLSCRHRRSRCNASITQSTFRELNEPNNCIEHLGAHGAPNLLCHPSAPFHPFIVTKVTILSRTTDLLRISILKNTDVFLNRRLY